MATTRHHTDDEARTGSDQDREQSRACYRQVLRVVEQNTGHPDDGGTLVMRAGIRPFRVRLFMVGHGRWTSEDRINRAIRAAREQGDLFKWADVNGDDRLSRTSRPAVEAVVAEVNRWDEPRRELLELCSRIGRESESA